MEYNKERLLRRVLLIAVFLIFFLYGLLSFRDYGVSFDEPVQRYHGLVTFKYVLEKLGGNIPVPLSQCEELDDYSSKYYGVAIKIPLILYEYYHGFNLTNEQIYSVNHLYTFLLFFVSVVFVYFITILLDWDYKYRLLALIIYFICPRILADSFYNIKDSVFLSLTVIMLYFLLSFQNKTCWNNMIGIMISGAFCVNTRIIGVVPLMITLLFYLLARDEELAIRKLKNVAVVVVGTVVFYIILSPASWSDPINYVICTLTTFSDYPWDGVININGYYYKSLNLPWYYLVLCMFITLPFVYTIPAMAGIVVGLKRIPEWKNLNITELMMMNVFTQLLSVLILDGIMRPVKYNMWRHFYFLFIYVVLLAVYGLKNINIYFQRMKVVINCFVIFSIVGIIVWNIENHPYEYVYFNQAFPRTAEESENDYWTTSFVNNVADVKNDMPMDVMPFSNNNIYFGEPGWENCHSINDPLGAEFLLNMWKAVGEQIKLYDVYNEITVDGRVLSTISKRRNYRNYLETDYINSNYETECQNRACDYVVWDVERQKETVTLLARQKTSEYDIEEIDIYSDCWGDSALSDVSVSISDDGSNWFAISDDSILLSSDFIAIILPKGYKGNSMIIRFELCNQSDMPNLLIRFFGVCTKENGGGIKKDFQIESAHSNYNDEGANFAFDGDLNTYWSVNKPKKKDQYFSFKLRDNVPLGGIILKPGTSSFDYPVGAQIEGSNDGKFWKPVNIIELSNQFIFPFKNKERYLHYRILQTGRDYHVWTISEIDALPELYEWNTEDTNRSIKSITSNCMGGELENIIDRSYETYCETNDTMNPNMVVHLNMEDDITLNGFHLDAGGSIFEEGRSIEFWGSYDNNTWKRIEYRMQSPYNYVFKRALNYPFYEIRQMATDDRYRWRIAQFGILH